MSTKQSELLSKTRKEAPKDEVSKNAQLLIRGGFVDKLMAGVYTISPLGLKVLNKIQNIIREEINKVDGHEMYMPALQPKENWEKTDRWSNFDGLMKVGLGDELNFALGPTHEEVVTPFAQNYISSYRDLPKYVYQFQNKFRGEKRAKSGLLRGREFIMKDLYSFHENQEDLDAYYDRVTQAYHNIFNRAGVGDYTYLTFASGGTFSKYSHEFQALTDAGEDIIYICDNCKMAVNKEIIEDLGHACPKCQNKELREDKAVEVGNIFKLGTRYSQPFDFTFTSREGDKKNVIMGCYGLGLQRLMGTIVEIFNDERGIIWPKNVAPFDIHLISLGKNDEAEKVCSQLTTAGFDVLFDDRDATAGEKFADSDLIGIPTRLIVSERSLKEGGYELKKRTEKDSQIVISSELLSKLAS